MSPFRSVIALLGAPAFGPTAVAGGPADVTDHQQGKGASPGHGAAGRKDTNGGSGLEHCAAPIPGAQGRAASSWVQHAVVMLH